jgi:hypothetical protein
MTPVTLQYFNEKSSLVFYFSLHLTYCQSMNKIPDLVEKTTSVSLGKYVFIIENYLITQVKLPLVELTSVLDDLKFKLENLQYSSEYENVRPKVVLATAKTKDYYNKVVDESVKLTLFSRVLSVSDGSNLCQKLNLPQLSLENIPYSVQETVLLNFEVRVENSKIICSSVDKLLRDDTCLDYILKKTVTRQFVRTKSDLSKLLLKNNGNKLYLVASFRNFYFSKSPYGTVGCLGETQINYKSHLQSLHSQYFFSLGNLYLNIFSALESYTAVLAESIHVLSDENYILPNNVVKLEVLIQKIAELLPKNLANVDYTLGQMQDFEKFFTTEVSKSNDDIISEFLDRSFLLEMPFRQLKQIYSAAEQFNMNLRYRTSKFFMNFVDRSFYKIIPNTVLFSRSQNPVTFINFIRALVPMADTHIVYDSFIIIQNCKAKLFNELKNTSIKT